MNYVNGKAKARSAATPPVVGESSGVGTAAGKPRALGS